MSAWQICMAHSWGAAQVRLPFAERADLEGFPRLAAVGLKATRWTSKLYGAMKATSSRPRSVPERTDLHALQVAEGAFVHNIAGIQG